MRFPKSRKVYDFDANCFDLAPGDWVVVETQYGQEAGQVASPPRLIPRHEAPEGLRPVLRVATEEDMAARQAWTEREPEAMATARAMIERHQLPMRLIDAEYAFDGSRLTFYFSAEGRVDFRALVKDLAGHFQTRIDLRQIGARDVARMVGGIGPCGLQLCCRTFLQDLRPVTLRMAKEQGLALNPEKLSGLCGRLMCCLAFEMEGKAACPRRRGAEVSEAETDSAESPELEDGHPAA